MFSQFFNCLLLGFFLCSYNFLKHKQEMFYESFKTFILANPIFQTKSKFLIMSFILSYSYLLLLGYFR